MKARNTVLGIAAGAGIAAAGTAVGVAGQRRRIARRGAGDKVDLGSLHVPGHTVVADDGVPLHVEIEEADPESAAKLARKLTGDPDAALPTLVYAHGYCLTMDSWHFQRAAYRGKLRQVFYDQRSHGRSGRSDAANATIEQLGSDLRRVIEDATTGPVIVIGHSMGGMSAIAFAEEYPELIGDRVVGFALMATTAGGLQPQKLLTPFLPAWVAGRLVGRGVSSLARGHRGVDYLRRHGRAISTVVTDRFAFGAQVPGRYVAFVDHMLSSTSFEVVAAFFPAFAQLDKFHAVGVFERVPTWILCGTEDRLTAVGHSRKLASRISGSVLVEYEQTGHMVEIERHEEVNAAVDDLIRAATHHVPVGSR